MSLIVDELDQFNNAEAGQSLIEKTRLNAPLLGRTIHA